MRNLKSRILASGVFALLTGCFFGKSKTIDTVESKNNPPKTSIYSIQLTALDGKTPLDLTQFKGKKMLIVNTASECGFTPQYEGLQKLQDKYADKLVVIGCPCNQFGGQEPGSETEISTFCKKNFGVTFPLTQKLFVKGENQHPLYHWLTNKTVNGVLDAEVKWNFNKFLISEDGQLLAYFASTTTPLSDDITRYLAP